MSIDCITNKLCIGIQLTIKFGFLVKSLVSLLNKIKSIKMEANKKIMGHKNSKNK